MSTKGPHRGPTDRGGALTDPAALRVGTLVGPALGRALRGACELIPLSEVGGTESRNDVELDLLLIDGWTALRAGGAAHDGGSRTKRGHRAGRRRGREGGFLQEITAWARQHEVPTALWISSPGLDPKGLAAAAALVDHVFTADARTESARDLRVMRAVPLPLAASSTSRPSAGSLDREIAVAYVGHFGSSNRPMTRRLAMVLEAAVPHGLRIFQPPADDEMADRALRFPDGLRPYVTQIGHEEVHSCLQRARIVVCADPTSPSKTLVPQVAFDALAAGCLLLAVPHSGTKRLFHHVLTIAATQAEAEQALRVLLSDDAAARDCQALGLTLIRHEHSYRHRLATIASAAGLRLVPKP